MQIEKEIGEPTGYVMPEPQAFIADPESDWGMVQVTKADLDALRSGDKARWDDLAAQFEAETAEDEGKKKRVGKAAKPNFIKEIEPSRANQDVWDEARYVWDQNGAIKPPYEKDLLCRIARTSGVLQECVRTYYTVIEGFGHTFSPVLDPDSEGAFDQVKWSMWNRRVEEGAEAEESEPTEEEVRKELVRLTREIQFQKMRAVRFFRNAGRIKGQPVGFIHLRQRLRQDYEITGEWYLEVLRDMEGKIRRLSYLPSVSMRQMPLDAETLQVEVKERVDDFTITTQNEHRYFRRYLQVDPDKTAQCWFKEIGDPRVLSSRSGKYYESIEELQREEPGVRAATEAITDGIPDPETPYGMIRWAANSPAIGGSRKAEEVNFAYFDNKTIPPFLILVSGGRLNSQAQERIKTYLKTLKGSENFHKLLVLEAAPFAANMPGQPPQRVQIEVVPLIKFLQDDALFLKYLAFNDTRIGANFSCPPLLRGRSEEYTRATARETLRFFENMVAEPERLHFDEIINTKIMLEIGLTLVRYDSLGADTSDPEVVGKLLDILLKHGSLLPSDGRQEAERLLRRELPKISSEFMEQPLKLTVAEVATRNNVSQTAGVAVASADDFLDEGEEESVEELAMYLQQMRKALKKQNTKSDFAVGNGGNVWTG